MPVRQYCAKWEGKRPASKNRGYPRDMESMRKASVSRWEIIAPEERRHPQVRRRLSGAAMRTFFNVAAAWGLSTEEQRGLLGWAAPSTFFKYKAGQSGVLSYDMLMRISLVLGMYKDLHILYPEPELADRWVRLPN